MTWSTSARMARLAGRIRFGLLTAVALLIGHNAVYVAEHGTGSGFATAMTALGHDGYWPIFTAIAIAAATCLAVGSLVAMNRLQRRLRGVVGRDAPLGSSWRAYGRELMSIWPRLMLAVVVLFGIQENIEAFASRGDLPGFDVLLGAGLPVAVPALGLITLAVAAVGALVRWRIGVLRARLRGAPHDPRPAIDAAAPAPEWAAIDAAAPHRWIPDRRDAGRAPPVGLPA